MHTPPRPLSELARNLGRLPTFPEHMPTLTPAVLQALDDRQLTLAWVGAAVSLAIIDTVVCHWPRGMCEVAIIRQRAPTLGASPSLSAVGLKDDAMPDEERTHIRVLNGQVQATVAALLAAVDVPLEALPLSPFDEMNLDIAMHSREQWKDRTAAAMTPELRVYCDQVRMTQRLPTGVPKTDRPRI